MRHALSVIAPVFLGLALVACKPQAPAAAASSPTPAAESGLRNAFVGDLDGASLKPYWGVLIRKDQISFSTAQPERRILAPNKGGVMQGDKAIWETVADGKPLKVVLTEQAGCSDGMTSLNYPLAAEVIFEGQTFKGCASKTTEKPKK